MTGFSSTQQSHTVLQRDADGALVQLGPLFVGGKQDVIVTLDLPVHRTNGPDKNRQRDRHAVEEEEQQQQEEQQEERKHTDKGKQGAAEYETDVDDDNDEIGLSDTLVIYVYAELEYRCLDQQETHVVPATLAALRPSAAVAPNTPNKNDGWLFELLDSDNEGDT